MSQTTPAAATTAAVDSLVALLAALSRFFPEGDIDLQASRGRFERPPADAVTFGVAPGFRSPRLVVPLTPRTAAPRALLRFSAASTYRDALTRLAAAGLSSVLGAGALPDRIVIRDEGPDTLATHLSGLFGRPVHFSVGVGSARVNRKPVLQLFDERGTVLGFAKVGDSPLARADVAVEGANLRRVEAHGLRGILAPRVLHETSWHGMAILVISPLAAGPLQATVAGDRAPLQAMAELARAFDEGSRALDELPWWRHQHAALGRIGDPRVAARALSCLDALAARAAGRPWRISAWHGDWTPWNMAAGRGRVRLWDWERFETGVPTGLDRVHYEVNARTRRRGTTAASIHGALGPADGSERSLIEDAYLAAVLVRYLTLAETSRGEHIAERGAITLGVLAERLGFA